MLAFLGHTSVAIIPVSFNFVHTCNFWEKIWGILCYVVVYFMDIFVSAKSLNLYTGEKTSAAARNFRENMGKQLLFVVNFLPRVFWGIKNGQNAVNITRFLGLT